jgi:hypothetical protein
MLMTKLFKKDIKNIKAALNQIVVHSSDDLFAFLPEESEALFKHKPKFLDDVSGVSRNNNLFICVLLFIFIFFFFFLFELILREFNSPSINDGFPTKVHRLKVNHTASTNSGRGGN